MCPRLVYGARWREHIWTYEFSIQTLLRMSIPHHNNFTPDMRKRRSEITTTECYKCPLYIQLYTRHEKEKKRDYNNRVLQVEKGSFAPLILSTTGGMGPESTKFHKRLAELIATKRGEEYSHVVSHIRTRLRFALLRCTLVAIRGERGRQRRRESPLSDVSFNLVPERDSYEMCVNECREMRVCVSVCVYVCMCVFICVCV